MKIKITAILLILMLVLTGCQNNSDEIIISKEKNSAINVLNIEPKKVEIKINNNSAPTEKPSKTDNSSSKVITSTEDVKFGMGIILNTDMSKETEENSDGNAQANSVIAVVTINNDGIIEKCIIEELQTKIAFDKNGAITTPKDTVFKTKTELGDAYGMTVASAIGKEWDEQAKSFADFMIGKTLDDVKKIAINDAGVPTDVELVSSCTMKVTDYVKAVIKAIEQADYIGTKSNDIISLGVETNLGQSNNADASSDGKAQGNSTYAAISKDNNGIITGIIIDASQVTQLIKSNGTFAENNPKSFKTKKELKEDYNMKIASKIGKEWYEQIAALEKFLIGKDKAKITTTQSEEPDVELVASCTIALDEINKAILKAYN